jgi:signal transduction histidine kinase/CheY-like chemotaxis protein
VATGTEGDGRRRRTLTVSRWLQVLAVVLFVFIVGVTVDQFRMYRTSLISNTERQMARLDMVFAEQTGRAVETVDLIVRGVIEALPSASQMAPDAFNDNLRRRIAGVRQMSDLVVTDRDGKIIYGTGHDVGTQLPAAGLANVQWHRDHPGNELDISEPIRDAAGRWVALMSRRINDRDGGFAGIVAGYLNLAYFEDFYKAVELNENGAILLHRRDGTVLARYPPNPSIIGRSYADLPPFKDILANDIAGTVIMDSPLDGSRRVLAIRALKAFPLAVNVSVDEDLVLRRWRDSAVTFAAAAVAAGFVVGMLLFLLARRSKEVEGLLQETRTAQRSAEEANKQLLNQMEERERAEAALRQAQRMEAIGQLTGGIAHDFNNLLTVILGNIDLLTLSDAAQGRTLDRLQTMRSAAERGATLTAQLLAFARRQPLVPRDVDVNALVTGMEDLLRSALGSRVRIVTVLSPELWPASIDPTQIELVILNLAINARDAMQGGGTLSIRTANQRLGDPVREDDPPRGDYVCITVADTGSGMAPDVLSRAAEPFFTTKGPGAGSGLGLSQVVGVASQSGGGVRIESKAGLGTSVHVYLPRASSIAGSGEPSVPGKAASGPRGSRCKVLVVDDDDAVRTTISQILIGLGYRVEDANSARAALALLGAQSDIELILSDLAMPNIGGAELARRARELRPEIPIVFISGYADPESIVGDGRRTRLIRKPFKPSELADQIDAALAESASV